MGWLLYSIFNFYISKSTIRITTKIIVIEDRNRTRNNTISLSTMSVASPINDSGLDAEPLLETDLKRKVNDELLSSSINKDTVVTIQNGGGGDHNNNNNNNNNDDDDGRKIKRAKLSESEQEPEYGKVHNETEEDNAKEWMPPSITSIENFSNFKTTTYSSKVPQSILENPEEPVELGVDEAGRGPVLGPMVYGIAYSLLSFLKCLQKQYGFADSKQLTGDKRELLFKMMEDTHIENGLSKHVGWATTTMTAKDISLGMLRLVSNGKGVYNLNEQAHDATIELIRLILSKGVNLTAIYVDTVGPPATYQAKLKKLFPTIDITVTKKADSIYPIVSTASVVAKVTRDLNLKYANQHINLLKNHALGSGYPSDPNTSFWLNHNVDPIFGWCFGFIRFSWQTAKDCLIKHNAVPVIYRDQCERTKGYKDVSQLMKDSSEDGKQGRISKMHYNSDLVEL